MRLIRLAELLQENIALCYADAKKDSTASPFSARLLSLSDVIYLAGPRNGEGALERRFCGAWAR